MKYDFTHITNRRWLLDSNNFENVDSKILNSVQKNTQSLSSNYSLKWNVKDSEIPAWVADMDFKIAPEITAGVQELVAHGIFGYSVIPVAFFESIMAWWSERYDFEIKKEWILFANGVIPAIASIIRAKSQVGDKILIQTPVYHVFARCIKENGRQVVENELIFEGKKSGGGYHIDFDDLEAKLSDEQVKIMLLCSPHNPIGRIWEAEELRKIGHLCARYNVLVIADEIHCDITFGRKYIPFSRVNENYKNVITTFSPSKSFNIADLHCASVVIADEELRKEMRHRFAIEYVSNPSAFGLKSSILAYTEGEGWLESLLLVLEENRKIVTDFIAKEIPELYVIPQSATYLMWIDCSALLLDRTLDYVGKIESRSNTKSNTSLDSKQGMDGDTFCQFLRKKAGLYVSQGSQFGGHGKNFFRLNIATPKGILLEILDRLKRGTIEFLESNQGCYKGVN